MAVTKIRKTSSTVFLTMVIISVVAILMFVLGGEVAPEEKLVAGQSQPVFTDFLLYWAYILLGVSIITLILFAVYGFFRSLKDTPKRALAGLLVLVALVAILGVSYAIGSGELLNIPGYEGTDNNPSTLKMTDMWIFAMYFMLVISVIAIVISPLLSKRK